MTSIARVTRSSLAISCVVLSSAACIEDAQPMADTAQSSVCPIDECGGNAASVGHLRIGEIHIDGDTNTGQVNNWGVWLDGFHAPDGQTGYHIEVRRGAFIASNGVDTLRGQQLIGSSFFFTDLGGVTVRVEIMDVDNHDTWTEQGYAIRRYKLGMFRAATNTYSPICQDAVDLDDEDAWAVLVSDERYSWASKMVDITGAAAEDWFNIACRGNALYKMKFMGYDPEPPNVGPYATTPTQRQATLKMLTADYCGTGKSFTEDDQPLSWQNKDGWSYNVDVDSVPSEAVWDAQGARCLGTPRLGPEKTQEIIAECQSANVVLPPCSGGEGAQAVWSTWVATDS